MRVVASACLLAAPAMALPRQLQAACGDDTAGRLEAAVGMDCAGAMAAIPTISGFSGEVCDFDLAVWLTDDVRSHFCAAETTCLHYSLIRSSPPPAVGACCVGRAATGSC